MTNFQLSNMSTFPNQKAQPLFYTVKMLFVNLGEATNNDS